MFSSLLVSLLLAAPPAGPSVSRLDPPIQLWINNDRRFLPGDRAKVQVRADQDGYLIVLHADPDGHLRVLFPIDPTDDNFVRGGRKYDVRGRGDRESFHVDNSAGRGTVYAAVSRAPFRFGEFVLADHWDYRTLAPNRLPEDPEPELNELVRRMADGDFDYDALTYDVSERVAYSSDYSQSRTYYAPSYYDDPWCGGHYFRSCGAHYGSPFTLSIGFGRPYYRSYYGYDPYYDPFFYDPYYYGPAYYPRYPYSGYRPNRYGYYNGYGYDRNRYYSRPYTPYRFRGVEGVQAGYRGQQGFRRSVNTVYSPPAVRLREPARSDPIRGALERREVDRPGQQDARRETVRREPAERQSVQRPSMERRPVEARRAREPEPSRSAEPARRDNSGTRSEARPRQEAERPQTERAPVRQAPEARPEARPAPAPRPEARPAPAPRPEARPSAPPPRVERPSPPPSRPSDGGGRRPSNGGGGRRR
ncbi:MAG: DUF4384 domain-containing protein [Gemmatimonadales bacterium]